MWLAHERPKDCFVLPYLSFWNQIFNNYKKFGKAYNSISIETEINFQQIIQQIAKSQQMLFNSADSDF